jgi:dihydroorotate dehydrogenase electron transfer subunit
VEKPDTVKVSQVVKETPSIVTIYFKAPKVASLVKPGQFLMVWIPRVDEIPISVSSVDDDIVGITVKKVGDATEVLQKIDPGEYIGIKGPYGNGFDLSHKRLLIVGGGVGIAPLALVPKHHKRTSAIVAAKDKEELFWLTRFKDFNVCTDNGSMGKKAFAPDLLKQTLKHEKFDSILCCGPEIMIKKCFEVAQKSRTHFQASLERWMKCGFGLCGSCSMDPLGSRVCKDGPVFDSRTLSQLTEFGDYKRNGSGTKHPI